jgi:hypothetical protein
MRGAPSLASAAFALWCAFAAFALERQAGPCDPIAQAVCPPAFGSAPAA